MSRTDLIILWLLCVFATATVVGGKLGLALFRLASDPPSDPELALQWERRRRWLAYSEISAIPAFATIAITAVVYWGLNPVAGILISMGLGGIGFALLLDALQFLFRRRLGMDAAAGSTGDA